MNSDLSAALDLVQGPVFRFAFALMLLGLMRQAIICLIEAAATRVMSGHTGAVMTRMRQRVVWRVMPHVLLRRHWSGGPGWEFYHVVLSLVYLVLRISAVLVPVFMVAHVYLWERVLGFAWPAMPGRLSDWLTITTIVCGLLVFLGRLYSPLLRKVEPVWSFVTPLFLIFPFTTGLLAMHPTYSPLSYQAVMLLHVLSATLAFVLVPFAGLLSFMHTPITRWVPEAGWRSAETERAASPAVKRETVAV